MSAGSQGNFNMQRPGFTSGGPNDPAQGGSGYYGGGTASGNFNMQRPGFAPGGANYPAQGGSGYTTGGTAFWGGDYGNLPTTPRYAQPGSISQTPISTVFSNYGNPWGQWSPPVQNPGMPIMPPNSENLRNPNTQTTPLDNPFAGISAGRLAQARRFADAGMFGRAKQQIGLGGGNWDDVGGLLRQEAKADPYVKGSSMGFDWGNVTAGRLAKAKELAAAGKMGQAKQMYEKGGGKWSPGMQTQFKAWAKANK